MTPEKLNRLAMWATIGILVVAGLVFAGRWATGSTNDADLRPVAAPLGVPDLSSTTGAPGTVLAEEPVESTEGTATTQPQPSVVLGRHIETSVATAPSATAPPTSTASSTTTGTEPRDTQSTTTTSPPPTLPTTTTLPSTTTTTTAPGTSTTTTAPGTSTTTTAPGTSTTTTVPGTSTTTTVPGTSTTTTVTPDLPGLFLERFAGQPEGGSDEWSARVDVDVGGTVAATYRGQVFVSWSGDGSGSVVLNTGGSGKASATVGPFTRSPITLTVTDVQAAGWIYVPSLNQTTTSLTIEAPDA
jgi:hypothetical protein